MGRLMKRDDKGRSRPWLCPVCGKGSYGKQIEDWLAECEADEHFQEFAPCPRKHYFLRASPRGLLEEHCHFWNVVVMTFWRASQVTTRLDFIERHVSRAEFNEYESRPSRHRALQLIAKYRRHPVREYAVVATKKYPRMLSAAEMASEGARFARGRSLR